MVEGEAFASSLARERKKEMKKYRLIFILLIFLLALSACAPKPKVEVFPIETVFAATYAAIMEQTAAAMPAETLNPTLTLTPRPTSTSFPTATIVVLAPTHTPTNTPISTPTNITSGSGTVLYACNILSQSPQGTYLVKPGERFTWTWQVENIGTTRWRGDSMSVVYIRGAQYALEKEYPLGDHINIGDNDIFTIKMEAPKEPGTYTTTWSLEKGIHNFCYAQLKIIVRK